MGKETKIGLAVIGVLMSVFGVLLFRHLQASHELPSRGLGDQTLVKPLPTHENVEVASSESRITGSKLWDTPSSSAAEPVEVAQSADANPYGEASESQDAAPTGRSPFQDAPSAKPANEVAAGGAATAGGNPLRQASAALPLEESDANSEGQAAVSDPLMTVPAYDAADTADPYAAEPPSADVAQALDAPGAPKAEMNGGESFEPAQPASSPAMRSPFDRVPPAAAAAESAEPLAANPAEEPAWDAEPAAPQDFSSPQAMDAEGVPAHENAPEPQYTDPQPPSAAFDRFESSAGPAATAVAPVAPATDAWHTSTPAAAPLVADSSAAEPLPIENGMYTVQPGDSLWTVSEAVYGTGGYFKALAAHNRAVLPQSDKLTVGSQISVPAVEDLQRDFPGLCPRPRKSAVVKAGATQASTAPARSGRDIYIVNEGDTLFTIARYELGKATRWAEIYDLNREALGEDFDYLRPGMELVMPARGAEAAARAAESRY